MSALNRSGPIEVPQWPSTRLPKRSRTEDHPSDPSLVDQYKRQIPLNVAITSSSSSDQATSNVALQPCLQSTGSYFLAPGQPDMNNQFVLDLYTRLVKFQQDTNQPDTIFAEPDHALQDLLHALARKLGLEFEYSLRYRRVCISKIPAFTEDPLGSGRQDELLDVPLFHDFGGNPELPSLDQMFVPDEMNFHMSDIFPENFAFPDQYGFQPELEAFDTSFVATRSQGVGQGVASEWTGVENLSAFAPVSLKDLNAEDRSASQSCITVNLLPVMEDPRMWQQVPILQHKDSVYIPFDTNGQIEQTVQISQNYIFMQDSDTNSRSRTVNVASSNAVKAIGGACWKCKVLRKKCDTQTTCHACVKGEKSSIWQEVGCRRGLIETQFPSPYSCPKSGQKTAVTTPLMECCESCERLHRELAVDLSAPSGKDTLPWASCFQALERIVSDQKILHFASLEALCMDFAQEWSPYRGLMKRALDYVALECMQHCPSRASPFQQHHECTSEHCLDTLAQKLELAYTSLLEELSRILFQKKNLKGDKSWWLPVFTSLCLVGLTSTSKTPDHAPAPDHLHLIVRLFAALSSNFDPLRQDGLEALTISDIWLRKTVGFDLWEDKGIRSSAQFLRFLFGIDNVAPESLASTIFECVQIDALSTEPSSTTTREILPVCTRRYRRPPDPLKNRRNLSTASTGDCNDIFAQVSEVSVDCDAFQFSQSVQAVCRGLL